jgi:hypothetical protein
MSFRCYFPYMMKAECVMKIFSPRRSTLGRGQTAFALNQQWFHAKKLTAWDKKARHARRHRSKAKRGRNEKAFP